MKKYIFQILTALAFITLNAQAQFKAGLSGAFVVAGTSLSVDGLALIPSADLLLNDTEITKTASVVNFPMHDGIGKTYFLSRPLNFSGRAGLHFLTSELNGNAPESLRISWSPVATLHSPGYLISNSSVLSFTRDYLEGPELSSVLISAVTAVSPMPQQQALDITNILSPNGDGLNDLWIVQNIQLYPGNDTRIFDHSAKMIFSQKGYKNTWDGKIKGQPLQEGTYYYVIDLHNGEPVIKGYITIIR